MISIVMDLSNAMPGKSSVNTLQHATIEEAVFSLDPTDAPIDCLDSDHMMYFYCRSCQIRGYISRRNRFRSRQLGVVQNAAYSAVECTRMRMEYVLSEL
jgi:hypothetical protein